MYDILAFWLFCLFCVNSAVVRHIALAPLVHVQLAHRTLQSLVDQPVQHGPAVITEGWPFVGVDLEAVGHVNVEAAHSLLKQQTHYRPSGVCFSYIDSLRLFLVHRVRFASRTFPHLLIIMEWIPNLCVFDKLSHIYLRVRRNDTISRDIDDGIFRHIEKYRFDRSIDEYWNFLIFDISKNIDSINISINDYWNFLYFSMFDNRKISVGYFDRSSNSADSNSFCLLRSPHHIQMASFVHDNSANLALISLLADAPNKFFTVRTKGRLTQKKCHEFMP